MRFVIALAAWLVTAPFGAAASAASAAAPVGDAWQRPALTVHAPRRAVLLSIAQAGERLVAVGERGIVALSDDAGRTWRQAPCPVSVTLTTVRFVDDRHGVAVGHAGIVLTTADAGASWSVRLDGRQAAQRARELAGTPASRKDAERLVSDGPDKPFLDVLVWDANRMLAVGAYGLAFHTEDGGRSWTPWSERLPNPKGLHWYVARRAGESIVLAGEQGLIARSDDGGRSFQLVTSPYKGSWFAGEFSADGGLLLAGLRGNVWRSMDAGANWTPIASPVPATILATTRSADGGVVLASQAGTLLKLQGDALVPLKAAPLPTPASLLLTRNGALWSAGVGGAIALSVEGRP